METLVFLSDVFISDTEEARLEHICDILNVYKVSFDGTQQETDDETRRREQEARMKEGRGDRQTAGYGAAAAGGAREETQPERGGEVERRKPTQE